jgi:hypothetical protein
MPDQEFEYQNQESPQNNLNVDADSSKLETEFQKYITDDNPFQIVCYCAFSGWIIFKKDEDNTQLGVKDTLTVTDVEIDYNSRIMRESGSSYCFNQIKPLISPLVSTSKLNDEHIYKMWRNKVRIIRYSLLRSYFRPLTSEIIKNNIYFESEIKKLKPKKDQDVTPDTQEKINKLSQRIRYQNPYDIDIDRLSEITTTLLEMSFVTRKALEGFTLTELAESFITSTIYRSGNAEAKSTGPLESIKNAFMPKKQR